MRTVTIRDGHTELKIEKQKGHTTRLIISELQVHTPIEPPKIIYVYLRSKKLKRLHAAITQAINDDNL